jgi:hypothetical protein
VTVVCLEVRLELEPDDIRVNPNQDSAPGRLAWCHFPNGALKKENQTGNGPPDRFTLTSTFCILRSSITALEVQ